MSKHGMAQALQTWEDHKREKVFNDTWGYRAPKKDKRYEGRIVWAMECYNGQGPAALTADFPELPSSPWLYESLHAFLYQLTDKAHNKEGCVYEWRGSFKNYKWSTDDIRMLMDTNERQY